MLHKKYVKSRDVVRVTFDLPVDQLPRTLIVKSITLAGEFNDWDRDATPLTFSKKANAYRVRLDLAPEQTFQFRYLLNSKIWYNDWAADDYLPNWIDGDNCVVSTQGLRPV